MLGATCCRGGALQLPVATSCGAASQRVLSAACAAPPAFYKMPCCTMCMLAAGSTSSFASERWLGEVRAASFSTNFACEPRGSRASEREHAAHMPLPCHEAPQFQHRGSSKLNVAVRTRQRSPSFQAKRSECECLSAGTTRHPLSRHVVTAGPGVDVALSARLRKHHMPCGCDRRILPVTF